MTDIENEVLTVLANNLEQVFKGISVYSDMSKAPAKFPAVFVEEKDNTVSQRYVNSDGEQYSDVIYEINIYSNKRSGKKAEAKRIAAEIDNIMSEIGFLRVMLNPVPNFAEQNIYRITGRYRATISKNKLIYRR